jgi:hypothetical protein
LVGTYRGLDTPLVISGSLSNKFPQSRQAITLISVSKPASSILKIASRAGGVKIRSTSALRMERVSRQLLPLVATKVLFALLTETGLRIGEAHGLKLDEHLSGDFSTSRVRQSVWRGSVQAPKADNAAREINTTSYMM